MTTTDEATKEERDAAHARIVDLVWDELKRVTIAIRNGDVAGLSSGAELAIKFGKYSQKGGLELRIEEENVAPIASLLEVVGQNLDVELEDGRLVVFSPSWPPDRIPF